MIVVVFEAQLTLYSLVARNGMDGDSLATKSDAETANRRECDGWLSKLRQESVRP